MSLTDEVTSTAAATAALAVCTNRDGCAKAAAHETIDWYPGPGEYCPECGEALSRLDADAQPSSNDSPPLNASPPPAAPPAGNVATAAVATAIATSGEPARSTAATATVAPAEVIPESTAGLADVTRRPRPIPRPRREVARRRRLVPALVVAIVCLGAIGVFTYFGRPTAADDPAAAAAISVCPVSSAQPFVADIVRAYAAKSGVALSRFDVRRAKTCDVRFTTASATSSAMIARDGIVAIVNPLNPVARISEQQLRGIFSGSIRDWAQVGGPPGPIVAVLPNDASDEAKALASSLFYGMRMDRSLNRPANSTDVTRIVTGADRHGRGAIGLVAFSSAVPAKVIPLAYLPPPSVLSIASGRYPYTLTIGVEPGTAHVDPVAAGLVEFARSSAGAEIVAKNGLVARGGI
jgi:hypothetical protein